MKWLFEVYPEKGKYIIVQTLRSIAYFSSLLPPILAGKIIDEFKNSGNTNHIIPIVILIVIIVLIGSTLSYTMFNTASKMREELLKRIREKCYKKLNNLDRTFYNENPSGDLVTIMTSDLKNIGYFYQYLLISLIMDCVSFIIIFAYFLTINIPLTFLILLPAPFMAYITTKFNKKTESLYEDRRKTSADLSNYIQENIEGNKVVKSFGNEEYEINIFKKKNKILKEKSLYIRKLNINYNNKIEFLSNLMDIILLLAGGILMMMGHITLGNLLVISSLTYVIQTPFLDIGAMLNDYEEYKISLSKIKGLLKVNSKIKDEGKLELDYKNQDIIFDNVDVIYDDTIGLKDINLTIKSGSTVACIGEVGSGKSTITRALLRFTNITNGELRIGNNKIEDYTLKSLRNSIGYVSQTPFLFSDTIKNNVNYGNLNLTDEEVIKYLKMAKADYALNLSHGIETVIGENGVSLSGGEKQRLSLARALAKKPKILILDDITSALDIETEISVTKNIEDLDYKCTKIIIAGKIFSVKNADIILVFKNNTIKEAGTHSELLRKNGIYKKIYDTQKESYEEFI